MEESKKLFSQSSIALATYFGGPIAAGYLIKKNFDAYDQKDNGNKAFIIGIVATIVIFVGIYFIPEAVLDKIPNLLIPAIYTGIIYLIVEKIQGKWLKDHKAEGGVFHSGWKATGIGAIFLVILVAFVVGVAYLEGDFSQPDFDAETYDQEVAKFVENEATSLAAFDLVDNTSSQQLIVEFAKGVRLWKENKEIIHRIDAIPNLPDELADQNKSLMKYCDLRIRNNELIIRMIRENTDQYNSEIDKIGMEINDVLEELNQ